MKRPTLYLDYDGVLHAEDVRVRRGKPPIIYEDNKPSDRPLFEHLALLDELLLPYPDLVIVLATSWVRQLGYERAREHLTPSLQARLIGATWHSHMKFDDFRGYNSGMIPFDNFTRYQTILADATRRGNDRWLALDDNIEGWPVDQLHRVVAPTDPILGLAQPGKADELRIALAKLCEV